MTAGSAGLTWLRVLTFRRVGTILAAVHAAKARSYESCRMVPMTLGGALLEDALTGSSKLWPCAPFCFTQSKGRTHGTVTPS